MDALSARMDDVEFGPDGGELAVGDPVRRRGSNSHRGLGPISFQWHFRVPAKAGTHLRTAQDGTAGRWAPACAGAHSFVTRRYDQDLVHIDRKSTRLNSSH